MSYITLIAPAFEAPAALGELTTAVREFIEWQDMQSDDMRPRAAALSLSTAEAVAGDVQTIADDMNARLELAVGPHPAADGPTRTALLELIARHVAAGFLDRAAKARAATLRPHPKFATLH